MVKGTTRWEHRGGRLRLGVVSEGRQELPDVSLLQVRQQRHRLVRENRQRVLQNPSQRKAGPPGAEGLTASLAATKDQRCASPETQPSASFLIAHPRSGLPANEAQPRALVHVLPVVTLHALSWSSVPAAGAPQATHPLSFNTFNTLSRSSVCDFTQGFAGARYHSFAEIRHSFR